MTSSARASAEPPDWPEGRVDTPSMDLRGQIRVAAAPGGVLASGISPQVSEALEASHVLLQTPGLLYSVSVSALTGGATGLLLLLNAEDAPADGPVEPQAVVNLAASHGEMTFSPPLSFGIGIVAVISSAATPFTKTTGVLTGFISGQVLAF